jgi:hypothetical protein
MTVGGKRSNKSFKSMQKGRTRSKSKSQSGGYPDSAWGNMLNSVGDSWTQFNNVINSPKPDNVIKPLTHSAPAPASAPAHSRAPQNGGKRRKHSSRSRNKKGGYWGAVLEQAIVPLTLLGLQQKFTAKRHNNQNKTRRNKRR